MQQPSDKQTTDLTVSGLIGDLQKMNEEIGCSGERTSSHSYPSRVTFCDTEGNTYRFKELDIETHMGCGCWVGVRFVLEKEGDA